MDPLPASLKAEGSKPLRENRPQGFQHLRIDRVSRNFGSAVALAGLDLTIQAGEFIALLGPSGCGKSTALNCVAGLLPLTGGSIWLDQRRIDQLPPERRGFGMVFQNYALFPHLTVRRNVAFGLVMRRLPKKEIRSRVDAALDLVQLEGHGEKLPGQLSGGQQQRVAVSRALAGRPAILLADEPTGNLDSRNGEAVMQLLRELHQGGATICMVTHDERFAQHADRTVHLFDGQIVEDRMAA